MSVDDEDGDTLNLDDVMVDVEFPGTIKTHADTKDSVLGIGITKPPRNTSKHPLPASCELKRSELGRTHLFLEGSNYSDVRCSASITQHVQRNSLFHPHRQNGRLPEVFTKPCDLACWHCVHSFSTPPIPVPKDYCAAEGVYHVFGCFCSLACAKSYLLETPTFNTGMMVMLLSKMGREIYNETEIQAAPPRLSLDIFGGPYTIDVFRRQKNDVTVHMPPFVSTYMVCEEQSRTHNTVALGVDSSTGVRGLRRPSTIAAGADAAKGVGGRAASSTVDPEGESTYSKFVREHGVDASVAVPKSGDRALARTSTLSQFMKK